MVSVRKGSTTEREELTEEELQRAAAAAAPGLFHQWVPTELLCQPGCCFPQNAGKPGKGGQLLPVTDTPPRPQGSSSESPSGTPGACHYDPERVTLANLWASF